MSDIEFPDAGELESWRAAADTLLQERRRITDPDLRCAAHKLQNAYLFVTALIKAQEPSPSPLPGAHIPHTCAGFMGATIGTTAHHPTPQAIWDAAIRSWIDLYGDARTMVPKVPKAKVAMKEMVLQPYQECVLTTASAHIVGMTLDPVADPRTPIPCTVCKGECGFWRDLSSTNDTWVACAACGGTGSV